MFDRIGRIADETPFVVEWLVNHQIRVWSAEEGEQRIDSHTDRLLNYIRFWQADGESQKTSIRTANSMHILTEQGYFTGGTCPYGYSLVKSGRMNKRKQEVHDLAICEEEASVLRLIFQLACTYGYGAQRIANYLNSQGYKNRTGENWHPATIQSILRNVLYTGILRSGETYSPIQKNLCIIDDKTFRIVQEMLESRSRKYQETRSVPINTRGNSLLAGNIFCGHCGSRLCISTSGQGRPRADGTDIRRTRYCCQTKTRKHGLCDGQTGYTVHKVDKIIDSLLHEIFSKVSSIKREEIFRESNRADSLAKKNHIRKLRLDCCKAESDLNKLREEIVRSLTGKSVFSPEMLNSAILSQEQKWHDLCQALKAAEDDLNNSENQASSLSEKYSDLLQWADLYDNADMAAKKMIVSHIIDRVDVFRGYEMQIKLNISIEQFLNTIERIA